MSADVVPLYDQAQVLDRRSKAQQRVARRVARRGVDDQKVRAEHMTGIISISTAGLLAVLLLVGRETLGDAIYYTVGWSCVMLLIGMATAHLIAPLLPPTNRF